MRIVSRKGKGFLSLLESLSHCPTDGVRVRIGRRIRYPEADGTGEVFMPICLFDKDFRPHLGRTWRHELQHARDALDGVSYSLTRDQLELRADAAEFSRTVQSGSRSQNPGAKPAAAALYPNPKATTRRIPNS